jgi:hypothetical protein
MPPLAGMSGAPAAVPGTPAMPAAPAIPAPPVAPAPSGGVPDGSGWAPGGGSAGAAGLGLAVLIVAWLAALASARRRVAVVVPSTAAVLLPHEVPG